jgi:hypothetical protein
VSGPDDATIKIRYGGPHGVSVFRDKQLAVEIQDARGVKLDIHGW